MIDKYKIGGEKINMITGLIFILGFAYAMERKSRKEARDMMRVIEYMKEKNTDSETFGEVLNAYERKFS